MSSFLMQSVVYLGSAILCVPIAKRLGLSSVLGYLLAGVVIGPYLLGWTGEQGKDLMHVAEFGVVVMLFLIGLELNPAKLWQLRVAIFGIGTAQVLATSLGLAIAFYFLGQSISVAIVIGLTLALSSTAIVLQSLGEKGQLNTAAGKMSFAVLLFQDLAVIPILAILPLLAIKADPGATAESTLSSIPAWLQSISVPLAVFAVVIMGRYIFEPLLKLIAATRLRELIVACALFIVLGIAELMTLVGISPALGAFLGGVLLANSAFRHQLETDLEPFKGLLLGLFFIAVGASMNFGLIASQLTTILSITVGLILFKFMVFYALGYFAKLNTKQRIQFSSTMSQASEFAFVILGLSLQLKITDSALTETLIAVVATSMVLSPLIGLVIENFILPNFDQPTSAKNAFDLEIEDNHKVILAGFGRFGSVVGRYLRANGVEATVLDNDPDRVDLLRKLGFKVYYGDATSLEMLEAAGIKNADMLILTLHDKDAVSFIINHVKANYPKIKLFVRAYGRLEAYELLDQGLSKVYRDSFETALSMGIDVLSALGIRKYSATRAAQKFRQHDEESLPVLAKVRHNRNIYVKSARERIEDQEDQLKRDMKRLGFTLDDHAWDSEPLRAQNKS